ncbi:hypothetical protein GCM10008967_19720 [Bacillus carboniphilus]|uniref:N-acetyltransferase domain-containing protein n=2 Tax=Bacillus carboniphilus TaxID=86663 RepID=A0ABN0W9X4_9BACI
MISIKRLSECKLLEAVDAWNKGFEGYYFDATTNVDAFTARLITEGLKPTMSVVAFDETLPIGLILSGTRKVGEATISWNGGTGVATAYRKQGVGKKMMQEALSIYKEENVDLAILEAILENEKAIALYEQYGYQVVDHLHHLQHAGSLSDIEWELSNEMYVRPGTITEMESLSFYQKLAPWQSYWMHGKGLDVWIAENGSTPKPVGYALTKKRLDDTGKVVGVTVLQCEVEALAVNQTSILHSLLYRVFGPVSEQATRMFAFLQDTNQQVMNFAKAVGFTKAVSQVYMMKPMTSKGEELLKEYRNRQYIGQR